MLFSSFIIKADDAGEENTFGLLFVAQQLIDGKGEVQHDVSCVHKFSWWESVSSLTLEVKKSAVSLSCFFFTF